MERYIAHGSQEGQMVIIAEQSKVIQLGFDDKGEDDFQLLTQINVKHPTKKDSSGDYFYFKRGNYQGKSGFYLLPLQSKFALHCPPSLLTFYQAYGLGNHVKLQDFIMALHESDYVTALFSGLE